MQAVFWISLVLVVYVYLGYAVLLALLARVGRRPVLRSDARPSVSVIMAARNEAANLTAKLENLRRLNYPSDRLQIVVASDGSTDGTAALLLAAGPEIVPVILPESGGKALTLNAAVREATGQILVFLDVRQAVEASAVRELVSNFADPSVGAVSGELLLEDASGAPAGDALGIYWKIEKTVRKLESATGSVVGVTGAIYAMRRELWADIPAGTILDDVYVPMGVAKAGWRVIFEPAAIARDRVFVERGKEFRRKVRTLTGNYQLLRLAPWILSPRNPLLFRFLSHKLLRLLVPVLLLAMLAASAALWQRSFFRGVFALQAVFYLLAALGSAFSPSRRLKPVAIATTFVMLNAAAAVAFYNFLRRNEAWA